MTRTRSAFSFATLFATEIVIAAPVATGAVQIDASPSAANVFARRSHCCCVYVR
jgi:hypothetical protein